MNAERLMLLGGATAFLMTVYWVRRRRLREKYAVIWLLVATLLAVVGLFPSLIMRFAESNRLSYPAAVLFIALGAIYLFAMSVSLSLTRAQASSIRLTQDLALVRGQVEALERELAKLRQEGQSGSGSEPAHISSP